MDIIGEGTMAASGSTTQKSVKLSTEALQEHDKGQDPQYGKRRMSIISNKTSDSGSKMPPQAGQVGQLRRRSSLKNVALAVGASIGMRRMSRRFSVIRPVEIPKVKLENTYKMSPDDKKNFDAGKVQKVMEDVLQIYLGEEAYNAEDTKRLGCTIANLIKERVKDLQFPRYKIVCNVILGQCHDQGIEMASRNLWDQVADNWACATYKNNTLFAIATVYGIYYE